MKSRASWIHTGLPALVALGVGVLVGGVALATPTSAREPVQGSYSISYAVAIAMCLAVLAIACKRFRNV